MEFSPLPELESLITTLFATNKCACHIINPAKTRILLWKVRNSNSELSSKEVKDNRTTYHLRIGIQKFTSQEQLDRNGEIYWRFMGYDFQEVKEGENNPLQPELDPITKFNQRQTKTQSLNSHDETKSVSNHSE